MAGFWEGLWKREEEFLLSGKPEFRHETSFIGVATIAGQFYCEYKVENEFAVGEISTEVKEKGMDFHDERARRLTADGTVLEDSRHCIIEEPKQRVKRYGEPYTDEMAANFEAHWVRENDDNWKRLLFTQDHVARAESLPNGKLMVWVNWDNARLSKFYRFRRERVNEGDAKLDVERYRLQLAYYAYQRNKQNIADTDEDDTQKEYQRVAETTMIGLLPLNQLTAF